MGLLLCLLVSCVVLLTLCLGVLCVALWVLWRVLREQPLLPDFPSAPWRARKFYA